METLRLGKYDGQVEVIGEDVVFIMFLHEFVEVGIESGIKIFTWISTTNQTVVDSKQ